MRNVPVDEKLTEFAGKGVVDWNPGDPIEDADRNAYRIDIDYDSASEGQSWMDRFFAFLSEPGSRQVSALVIGLWSEMPNEPRQVDDIVSALVTARERLPRLTALFLGDIVSEEWEISWLQQSDVSPLFAAFPLLEEFWVRGGTSLHFGRVRHEHLKTLVVQSGGLPASVVQEIGSLELPALEYLELWLGVSDYGGDASVEDLALVLSGEAFPHLKYLGLRDSEIADQVAVAVASAPILRRLLVLDLSLGALGDVGAAALIDSPSIAHLQKLDIHHHYCSPDTVARLESLGIAIDAGDRQDEDKYGRYVAVSE